MLFRSRLEIERSDGTIISLTLAPLPDGATLASFADVRKGVSSFPPPAQVGA